MYCEANAETILAECEAYLRAHPNSQVRLLGLDDFAQYAGTSMVIFRGQAV